MVRRYRFEDISTPNRRLNEPMAVQGPWEAPALEQDCLKGVATRCDSGRRTCFYFHWGLLASIYFHRPWRCQLQLPRMPNNKCHTLRDHILFHLGKTTSLYLLQSKSKTSLDI